MNRMAQSVMVEDMKKRYEEVRAREAAVIEELLQGPVVGQWVSEEGRPGVGLTRDRGGSESSEKGGSYKPMVFCPDVSNRKEGGGHVSFARITQVGL
jgi:hypothetical protein